MKNRVIDRRKKAKVQSIVVSLTIGATIGGLAGYGHLKSVEACQQEKLEYLKSISVVDYDELREEWDAEHPEEVKGLTYTVTELTDEDLALEEYYDSLEMLAQLVEAEAGNQSLEGKRLVVDVVLNRVDSDSYPNTIEEVILQNNQFACIKDGGFDRAGYRMQDDDYTAVKMELEARLDSEILYFTAGNYGDYGTPAYQHGDHYFSN